jgi:lipase ATG15
MRGYVYGSEDNRLIVIAIKGTSAAFFGVGTGPTSARDKQQDNLMFSCCCAAVDRSW